MFLQKLSPHLSVSAQRHFRLLWKFQVRKAVIAHHRVGQFVHCPNSFRHYFQLDDFRDVTNFNTQETLNALGFATSDIAEMGLTEISKTITALNRQNRIIVGQDRNEYNKVENNDERSLDNERTDLNDGGRLQPSEPETSTAAGSDVGQIRSDEERVSEGTSQSPLLQSPEKK